VDFAPLVSTSVAVTIAPTTKAPCESVTVPVIVAVLPWLSAMAVPKTIKKATVATAQVLLTARFEFNFSLNCSMPEAS
jgi:hypothetical protein